MKLNFNKTQKSAAAKSGGMSIFVTTAALLKLVGSMVPVMVAAVVFGSLGHIAATLIPALGFSIVAAAGLTSFSIDANVAPIFYTLIACALMRGILRYAEQYCNHYIAFKTLAMIRDKVFGAMRKLCPAKLEGRERGELINIITSDVELLEVFYAHTISPVLIALIHASLLTAYLFAAAGPSAGVFAAACYIFIGAVIPIIIYKRGSSAGVQYRKTAGELAGTVLDSLRGLPETLQYADGEHRLAKIVSGSEKLSECEKNMKRAGGLSFAATSALITIFGLIMLLITDASGLDVHQVTICFLLFISSFGPTTALAALGSTLQNTMASAERVLIILDETPETPEITGNSEVNFGSVKVNNISFSYKDNKQSGGSSNGGIDNTNSCTNGSHGENFVNSKNGEELVLDCISADIEPNKIYAVTGRSGSGKSTLLRLLMRFWTPDSGCISISGRDLGTINTENLRKIESLVTQDTHIFNDSIANNLRIAKLDATDAEIEAACKKAAIHDFISGLPSGYETKTGELGETLSGGEKQRLGVARAFLSGAPFMLLDEPTSNLDSLNEAIILSSLHKHSENKTIVLVSHRASTVRIADKVLKIAASDERQN